MQGVINAYQDADKNYEKAMRAVDESVYPIGVKLAGVLRRLAEETDVFDESRRKRIKVLNRNDVLKNPVRVLTDIILATERLGSSLGMIEERARVDLYCEAIGVMRGKRAPLLELGKAVCWKGEFAGYLADALKTYATFSPAREDLHIVPIEIAKAANRIASVEIRDLAGVLEPGGVVEELDRLVEGMAGAHNFEVLLPSRSRTDLRRSLD